MSEVDEHQMSEVDEHQMSEVDEPVPELIIANQSTNQPTTDQHADQSADLAHSRSVCWSVVWSVLREAVYETPKLAVVQYTPKEFPPRSMRGILKATYEGWTLLVKSNIPLAIMCQPIGYQGHI